MTSNGNGVPPPQKLLGALESVWKTNDELVKRFGLEVMRTGIEEYYGVWAVPVASGVQQGSSYDLTRALNSLQEQVENVAQVPVTILLDH